MTPFPEQDNIWSPFGHSGKHAAVARTILLGCRSVNWPSHLTDAPLIKVFLINIMNLLNDAGIVDNVAGECVVRPVQDEIVLGRPGSPALCLVMRAWMGLDLDQRN
jgi:hypothetical protein